jgi:predicted transcriptional regulator
MSDKKNYKHYLKVINQIQKIRSKNNINWMNILKLAFKTDPTNAKKIMKQINFDDKKISSLLKKLTK